MLTTLNIGLLTTGADRVAQTDPHGFILTLVSVSVVFAALLILYFIYSLIGRICSKDKMPKPSLAFLKREKGSEDEIAAAIAMALEAERGLGSETEAAIATALHLYLSGSAHDAESGIITITHRNGGWDDKKVNFRKKPELI